LEISEIIAKVKRLEIVSKRLTQHLFAGEYHSAFKGRGMSFKEVREYQHGDDTRMYRPVLTIPIQKFLKKSGKSPFIFW
jgi:hypothetical protein